MNVVWSDVLMSWSAPTSAWKGELGGISDACSAIEVDIFVLFAAFRRLLKLGVWLSKFAEVGDRGDSSPAIFDDVCCNVSSCFRASVFCLGVDGQLPGSRSGVAK